MQQLLEGKRAIITGATAGIGRAIALFFIEQGAHVSIWGTNEARAQETVEMLTAKKSSPDQQVSYQLLDVGDKSQVETAVAQVMEAFGSVEILVNNAGITKDQLLMKMSEEDWDTVLRVNLKSIYHTCKALVRPMMKARVGSIINISSVVALTGNAGQVNYAASKAGVIGFSKSLAKELAPRNIRVNCVAPGYVATQMTEVLSGAVKEKLLEKIPLGRIGKPEEIASMVGYLASDLSSYVTGQVMTVDGGMTV